MSNRVVELFAGVGGFHLAAKKSGWEVIWANEWFPDTIVQHAHTCYEKHFPGICVNEDIAKVIDQVPDHDLLVGGFPCQDYSVAASGRKGIRGKKGVLWWELAKVIHSKRPKYILLENVDRLLKSPKDQRGRDFAIMLATLDNLGYSVEWRVINSGEYGYPQRRRRVFIFAWKPRTKWNTRFRSCKGMEDWLIRDGLFAGLFPAEKKGFFSEIVIPKDPNAKPPTSNDPVNSRRLLRITREWPQTNPDDDTKILVNNPFRKAGIMSKGLALTMNFQSVHKGRRKVLKHILEKEVDESYYLDEESMGLPPPASSPEGTWWYVKGAKAVPRKDKVTGFEYTRTEGAISFPDPLDRPSRTIVTAEGGPSPVREKHVVEDETGRYRRLTPVEVERLNGFRKNWTNTGMPESKRYYCMGNSLVVGLVTKMMKGIRDI